MKRETKNERRGRKKGKLKKYNEITISLQIEYGYQRVRIGVYCIYATIVCVNERSNVM